MKRREISPYAEFARNKAGVHMMVPGNGEYSLCGMAMDAGSSGDNEDGDLKPTPRKKVTCPQCCHVVNVCQNVRTKFSSAPGSSNRNPKKAR
jgi:hypothetical protein